MPSGGSAKYPAPTAEERQLMLSQTGLLDVQTGQIRRGAAEQQALQPLLYRMMGLTPQFGPTGEVSGFATDPQFEKIMQLGRDYQLSQAQYGTDVLGAQRGLLPQQVGALESQLGLQQAQNEFNLAQQQRQEAMQPLLYEEMGVRPTYDAEGNITGFENLPDELRAQREDILRLQQERSLAALRGELPTDPALLRDLQEREALTRASLRQQLGGAGYDTTTAGSEALGRFEEARAMTLDQARRADLSMAETLALNRMGANQQFDLNRFNQLSGVRPSSFMQQATLGGALGGGGGGFGGLNALAGLPGGGGGQDFSGAFSGFNQIMGQLAETRGQQFQSNVSKQQAQQANNQLYGGLAGAAASTAAVVAAMAGGSSRSLKRDIVRLSPESEARTLGELLGED